MVHNKNVNMDLKSTEILTEIFYLNNNMEVLMGNLDITGKAWKSTYTPKCTNIKTE